jgi:hypothetical protein
MRILLRAAIAAVSFASIGPANAGEMAGPLSNTLSDEIPGVIRPATAQNAHFIAVTASQTGGDARR